MNLPTTAHKTFVNTSKTVNVADSLPAEIRKEYADRLEALKATEAVIESMARQHPEISGLRIKDLKISKNNGAINAEVRFSTSIEGRYVKLDEAPFIDPSTFNLLMNQKILTHDEKRALLQERGLIPKTQNGAANEAP